MKTQLLALAIHLISMKEGMSMSAPKTLLELSGVHPQTPLEKSVLVLIDYQNEYVSGRLPLFQIGEAVRETRKLLTFARERQIPVIHVIHKGGKGGLFDISSINGEIISDLKPVAGEVVIQKTYPNAFAGTELHRVLQNHSKRTHLIVAGLMTHMCLSSTVSSAIDHGYTTTVIASTTTTRDLKGTDGATIAAAQIKAAALATLKDRFANLLEKPEALIP